MTNLTRFPLLAVIFQLHFARCGELLGTVKFPIFLEGAHAFYLFAIPSYTTAVVMLSNGKEIS